MHVCAHHIAERWPEDIQETIADHDAFEDSFALIST
jgi:hypothetical protein